MKLNVIVTAFNVGDFIYDCIESIQNQITKFEFKIIIRDDGSKDDTRNILLELSQKYSNISIILDDTNIGVHKSVEQLISLCDSEYIATLDGDDFFVEKFHLQKQVDFLDNNPTFVMSCCGAKVEKKGELFPIDDLYIVSGVNPIQKKDLLKQNFINFGRVFRNLPSILPLPKYYFDCYNDDWALNFKILTFGDAMCLDYYGGVYRIHENGRLQKFNQEEINEKNKIDRKIMTEEFSKEKNIVTIIDCFVHNNIVENLLRDKVNQLKSIGKKIFLISNSQISEDILKNVDYFFFNKENHLFDDIFGDVPPVVFWSDYGFFRLYKIEKGYQRHALSVLRNLTDALKISKQLGYTHFERLEVDSNYNDVSLKFLDFVPKLCDTWDKIGLFYENIYETEDSNVSFHYFYSKIDEFLELLPEIRTSQDYVKWLEENYQNKNFKNVEIFIYESLKKFGIENFLIRNGVQNMDEDFGFINWNTVTSISNLSSKYDGVVTKLLPIFETFENNEIPKNTNVIFSESKIDEIKERTIFYYENQNMIGELRHTLQHEGHWIYNEVPKNVNRIEVFENNNLLYSENLDYENGKMVFL